MTSWVVVSRMYFSSAAAARRWPPPLAQVRIKDRWGYIDVRGNTAVPCIYEACEPFQDGTAKVRRDGRWGLLNSQGEEILPCEYDTLEKEEAVVIHYLHTGRDTTLIIEKGRHIDEQKS